MPAAQEQTLREHAAVGAGTFNASRTRRCAAGATPAMTMPYAVREEAVTAGAEAPYNGYAHSFAGMGIQFLLFAAIEPRHRASCSNASAGSGNGFGARRSRG